MSKNHYDQRGEFSWKFRSLETNSPDSWFCSKGHFLVKRKGQGGPSASWCPQCLKNSLSRALRRARIAR